MESIEEYLNSVSPGHREAVIKLREIINRNIPAGFTEGISYGMIGWFVPHSLYPKGYHCNPSLSLPFLNLASTKSHIALYHMGVYADKALLDWYMNEFAKTTGSKPDMGKSCLRFKKPEKIPFELIGTLATKITPQKWIKMYETNFVK